MCVCAIERARGERERERDKHTNRKVREGGRDIHTNRKRERNVVKKEFGMCVCDRER